MGHEDTPYLVFTNSLYMYKYNQLFYVTTFEHWLDPFFYHQITHFLSLRNLLSICKIQTNSPLDLTIELLQ